LVEIRRVKVIASVMQGGARWNGFGGLMTEILTHFHPCCLS